MSVRNIEIKSNPQEYVKKVFASQGLVILDTYQNCHTPLHCVDIDGYEYMRLLGNVYRGDALKPFHTKNPFTVSNIKRYLSLNGYTCELLSDEYKNSSTKMKFRCECGKIFEASWNSVICGKRYCNFCAKSKRFDGLRDYTSAVKEHCEKAGYTLLTEYIHRSRDKFEYICNKHKGKGVQTSSYDQMIGSQRGCWHCGREAIGLSQRSDEKKFIDAIERNGFIYVGVDYNNEGSKYKRAKIQFICPKHKDKGVQTIKYNNLLKNKGNCRYCVGQCRTKYDLQQKLDDLSSEIDVLEYEKFSIPTTVKCRVCGNVWTTMPSYLFYGSRCPNCQKSKFEADVGNILTKWGYAYKYQHWYDDCRDIYPLPFDFYLPDFNILIEADGEQHYHPIRFGSKDGEAVMEAFRKTQLHDNIKTKYCKKKGLRLIRIPYWERDELEYFLWDALVKAHALEVIAA